MTIRDRAYSAEDVAVALRNAGVSEGDILFSHVAPGALGLAKGCRSADETCALLHRGVRLALGGGGTFIVPSYTYSFTRGEDYDPATTPSTIGHFTEYFRLLPGVIRSDDPLFSVAAEGPAASKLLSNLPRSSFDADCVYGRLWREGAIIANLGLSIEYLTFLHYVEAEWGVPYRYNRTFTGRIHKGDAWRDIEWDYMVRILADNTVPHLKPFRLQAMQDGTLKQTKLGMGSVEAMRCVDIKRLVIGMLDKDVWSLIQGPAFDTEGKA